jgi:glycosyltransferase involved in cell wall biosynthesis
MKVLYYCPEYYYRHGGRTHARGFFGALQTLPAVSAAFLYPKDDPDPGGAASGTAGKGRGKLRFLPPALRKIVQFFRPRPGLTAALINDIKQHDCDVLVIRTGTRLPALGAIKKACPNTVICLEMNSAYFDEEFSGLPFRRLAQQLEVRRFRPADGIFVVSSYVRDYLQARGIARDRIVVNQNGVNTTITDFTGVADVRAQYGIPANAFVIGYIGGMEEFRRLPEVVTYIAQLRRAGHRDIYFLVVGDGSDMVAVRAAIEAERSVLEDAVILTGWVPHADITGYLAAFDLAIFPFTNAYCSPLKLFEYLGAGIPTIGPDTSAVREVFEDNVHLRLVKQDGSDFVTAILDMKNNAALRVALGKEGQRLVLDEFTWERNAERVVQYIQQNPQRTVQLASDR